MQTKKLNDGVEIPVYGFGTFQIPADGSTYKAVRELLILESDILIQQLHILMSRKSVRLSVKVVFQEKRYSLQANSGYRIMDMNQRKKVSKHLLEN